jgi:hypothetical protein
MGYSTSWNQSESFGFQPKHGQFSKVAMRESNGRLNWRL